ncbi:MAG: MBL fold metallo-hydrolase [Anaerolineae bacterium]|nr:MBL fold metallo-hydrolase [Anaerolineae bacterium]
MGVEWFGVRVVGDATWAIDDRGSDMLYLVAGQERCLLIDTGWGVGDLPALAASLSPLPVVVVNTHGHPDHAFGNGQFAQVYVHAADEAFVRAMPSAESREWIVENILPTPLPADFQFDTWGTAGVGSLVAVQDGHVFDLGGRALQVVLVPGHTPGSICLLDRQARLLFTGDSVLPGTVWLHLDESLPLRQFHKNLQRLQGFTDEFDYILPGHADLQTLPLPKAMLDDLVAGIGCILTGELVGREEKTFAGDGLRCDFGSCGIVYRPDRLEA